MHEIMSGMCLLQEKSCLYVKYLIITTKSYALKTLNCIERSWFLSVNKTFSFCYQVDCSEEAELCQSFGVSCFVKSFYLGVA